MFTKMRRRVRDLQTSLQSQGVDMAIIMDADSIFYYAGVHDHVEMEIGRPMILCVSCRGEVVLLCPDLELNMARAMTWVERIEPWSDGVNGEWRSLLKGALGTAPIMLGLELTKTHPPLLSYIHDQHPKARIADIGGECARQRLIKDDEEIAIMRKAGLVAVEMCRAARDMIAPGVTEYELGLAIAAAGTRKSAELLADEREPLAALFSPMIHGPQVLQSGPNMHMVHKRAGNRRIESGESVYMCFCNNAEYRYMKVGFDRQYFLGGCTPQAAKAYDQALTAQKIALNAIRPGIKASEVHQATAEYYSSLGSEACYRTGRAVGYSRLERPELSAADETVLAKGMTFAVDGAVSLGDGAVGRVGDTIVVTEDGFDYITVMDKTLCVL